MATKQQSLRLDYLLQASNQLISQYPTLSRFYMQHYQETLRQNDLRAPRPIDRLSCPRCGQIYLAGYNTTVALESSSTIQHNNTLTTTATKNKKKRDQKNTLVYTCHACHHQRKFNGSFKRHIPTSSACTETTTTNATTTDIPCSSGPSTSLTSKLTPTPGINNNKNKNNNIISNNNSNKKKNTMPSTQSTTTPSNKRSLGSISSPSPNQQQPSKKKSKGSK